MKLRQMMIVLVAIVLLFVVYGSGDSWKSTMAGLVPGTGSESEGMIPQLGSTYAGFNVPPAFRMFRAAPHIYRVPFTELPSGEIATGVPSSVIIADMSLTYDMGNGIRESCDLCPNGSICPECPQYMATPLIL